MTYPSKSRDEGGSRLLQPNSRHGSVHHQRHNSATRAETGRYFGAANPRTERAYHTRGPYVEKAADSRQSREPTVEYTGPREQFDRDYPVPPRKRRESLTRKERPVSVMDTSLDPAPSRRETIMAPPSANRQLARLDRDDRRSGFESDPDRSRDHPRVRRHSRGPVVHQRDEGYSSERGDYEPRSSKLYSYEDDKTSARTKNRHRDVDKDYERDRDRDRPRTYKDDDKERERRSERPRDREYERERERDRRPRDYEVIEDDDQPRRPRKKDTHDRDREASPERSNLLKSIGTAAIGGLAAAGIAGKKSKDEDGSDSEYKRERRQRRRSEKERRDVEEQDPEARRRRKERRDAREVRGESSGSDTPDENLRRRPQSRTRHRRNTDQGYGSDRERPQLTLPAPDMERTRSRDADVDNARAPLPDRAQQESPTNNDGRTLSPGDGEDGRSRRVSILEPAKKEDVKPRGILKPSRTTPFPEDPNPQREGVAPLKQAGKEGIPPGARWTKVSRILVNPEALQRAHERYEERDDYVIVLRVLSREEIEKLAEKTREIRGTYSYNQSCSRTLTCFTEHREKEWQREVEERRRRRAERGEPASESDNDSYDDPPRRERLALEAAPTEPQMDLRQLAAGNSVTQAQPQQPQPQPVYAPQQTVYQPQQQAWQSQGYPAQQAAQQPYVTQQHQPYASQHAPAQTQSNGGQQYANVPGQWQTPRSSAEAIAATAPGQPVPSVGEYQQQPQVQHQPQSAHYESSAYNQNV